MTNEEITVFLYSYIEEVILYPSLGTLPYTIIIHASHEVPSKHRFQQNISHYVAFYTWDDFNQGDLLDFLSNTREAQKMDELHKKIYVEKMSEKLQNPTEYKLWLSKQVALAIGMMSGFLSDKFKIKMTNPIETEMLEEEQLLTNKQGLSLNTVICLKS